MSNNVPHSALIPPTPEEITPWWEEDVDKLRAELRAKVVADIKYYYHVAAMVLGKEEADREWKKAAEKPKGRPSGSKTPAHDKGLLRIYDIAMKLSEPAPSLAWIGKHVYETTKGEYGASAEAIATKLRRLLKMREARLQEQRCIENIVIMVQLLIECCEDT